MNGFGRLLPHVASVSLVVALACHSAMADASSLTSLGHNAGAQCVASDVNDSGISVGTCSPPSSAGPAVAWLAQAGQELSLPSLAAGRSCHASGISNGGQAVGGCVDASGIGFAVVWNPGPTGNGVLSKLLPRPGVLGLLADVTTQATAYNQAGDIAGVSGSGSAVATAVIWRTGSTTAIDVSSAGDNCVPADVGEPTAQASPAVLMNCPSGTGTASPVIATPGLLGLYQKTVLTKASGASYCVVQSMNASSRIMGTCIFPTAPTSRVAYWVSPASTATAPSLSVAGTPVKSVGDFMNAQGNIVLHYQTADGKSTAAYLVINEAGVATSFIGIPALHSGTTVGATGLGDNGLVTVGGQNASENAQAAVWNPASPGTLSPIALFGGGSSNGISAVSKSGAYAVGVADDSAHVTNAVVTTLP